MWTRWWVFLLALMVGGFGLEPGERMPLRHSADTVVALFEGVRDAMGQGGESTSPDVALSSGMSLAAESTTPDVWAGDLVTESGMDPPCVLPSPMGRMGSVASEQWPHGPAAALHRPPTLEGLLRPPSDFPALA